MSKLKKKQISGITLIALVVTIIVLLLLAGISIQMLSGNNSILTRAEEASRETIHTNVYEQLQLKATDYFIKKNLGTATEDTLIEYLQNGTKPIISEELGEEGLGKYQIYVQNLLGTTQKYGKGTASGSDTTAYKDVYMLERVELTTGNLANTKIASTKPIKIATSTQRTNYTVKYYGTETGSLNGKLLGNIGDTDRIDIEAKIMAYLKDSNSYDENGNLVTNLGINEGDLKELGHGHYRYKNGKIYKASYYEWNDYDYWNITKVENVNLDVTIDSETETIITPFGIFKKNVEGEENNDPTWYSVTDENDNQIYEVSDGEYIYLYDASGTLIHVLRPS